MRGIPPSGGSGQSSSPQPKRPCRREEFIPNCDEEMQEWMEDRHKDLQAAMVVGRLPEVARVSHLLTNCRTGVATVDPTTVVDAFCSGQFCEVLRQHVRRSHHIEMVPCDFPVWSERSSRRGGVESGSCISVSNTSQRQVAGGHRPSNRFGGGSGTQRCGTPQQLICRMFWMVRTISGLLTRRVPSVQPHGFREEDEFDARNVAQRRSIEHAPRRRLRVMGVFQNVSQVSLSASTVPASSSLPCGMFVNTPVGLRMRNSSTDLRKI